MPSHTRALIPTLYTGLPSFWSYLFLSPMFVVRGTESSIAVSPSDEVVVLSDLCRMLRTAPPRALRRARRRLLQGGAGHTARVSVAGGQWAERVVARVWASRELRPAHLQHGTPGLTCRHVPAPPPATGPDTSLPPGPTPAGHRGVLQGAPRRGQSSCKQPTRSVRVRRQRVQRGVGTHPTYQYHTRPPHHVGWRPPLFGELYIYIYQPWWYVLWVDGPDMSTPHVTHTRHPLPAPTRAARIHLL